MTQAINAIRRLENKIEDLTTTILSSPRYSSHPPQRSSEHLSTPSATSQPMIDVASHVTALPTSQLDSSGFSEVGPSPQVVGTPSTDLHSSSENARKIFLSFSQHGVAAWPAMKQILPASFVISCEALGKDYVVEYESQRQPLPMDSNISNENRANSWLTGLPLSVVQELSDAYFAVFHRNMPVLDKFYFFSSTLSLAMESSFDFNIETCLVLNVLALGCLAVKAYEEGNFALPSQKLSTANGFVRPEWYDLMLDDPPGLRFFNEARKRVGFLMCQNDLQAGHYYMLSTLYYAQIVRPIDSWVTVNRTALHCTSMLKRHENIDFDAWEGDMLCRLFWNALMYESIITQELDLPLSGLQEFEADMPIPKFTSCPRPKTSISGLLVDDDDSFFNFHFLAQAAHRIILNRVRYHMYSFIEKKGSPTHSITTEMHHQVEQWRSNLPPSLQFSDEDDDVEDSASPAHVIAKAMLRSRYFVAKFHIGRPYFYKALHAPAHMNDSEYTRVAECLRDGMYWPTTMGLCTLMKSALPLKFGWCSQCFGQVLLFHAAARSGDAKLRATLPPGWRDWVHIMMQLIESCGKYSPAIAKDAEILQLL
ncbi:hypothetical protein CC78DRAFT_532851 [Lojkania enalia]|uniref:Transcription factor domain-containing protein n=1 Tax=Lojkania enalia TaxID=147567 RepID=A0A9P4KB57_9PLEO|nr:hypothetical protein CC78DRAFT_532851 [Didymosphaeria enalia]